MTNRQTINIKDIDLEEYETAKSPLAEKKTEIGEKTAVSEKPAKNKIPTNAIGEKQSAVSEEHTDVSKEKVAEQIEAVVDNEEKTNSLSEQKENKQQPVLNISPKKILGKMLATLRKTNPVLYATISQVSDILLKNNCIVLVFNALTFKEECEKRENIDELNKIVKDMKLPYSVVCESKIVKTEEVDILQLLKDEFEDLLVIQNKKIN